ncbi:MATE family efflux transporter [Stenotrophomonas sp. W1S232]|uniref:MATE family efflux transporter n=2 Tax=Stenotrophomonas koreensis TaxID=266128 RepID=A0A7W3YVW7_9GAMM|nr:MATE family efflux transporter [Stenotrophomonas koreensis]
MVSRSTPANPSPSSLPTRTTLARQALPIILAGASVPLLGMVDTAVIGHYGSAAELGALAVGALLFNFLYWAFGFLRMATTGFVAQAAGGGQAVRLQAAVLRPLLLGLGIGLALWLLHAPLSLLFHAALGSTPALEARSDDYVAARIWGAPAALALYALCGSLIGLGRGGALLAVQLLLNGLNALLDIWFAGWLGMGLRGIGLGTAIAEWTSCALALWLLRQALREHGVDLRPAGGQWLGDRAAWRALWSANGDLLLRTLCLLAGFAWFARQGSQLGEVVLAGNHLLLQLVAFCAFFLDGFAHVTEAHVGRAIGRGDRSGLRRVVRLGGELAAATALGLALLVLLGGGRIIAVLTDLAAVVAHAQAHLPWVAAYVLLSVAAFQLDGMFIGATATAPMRRSALYALLALVLCSWPAQQGWGSHGLWLAMLVFAVVRALVLLPAWRLLAARVGRGSAAI